MTPVEKFNQEQLERWNGADGEYWVQQNARLDRTLEPVMKPLIAFAAPRLGSTVIDVGCGCGATTLELARAVGPAGRVAGIDLSEPMVALARERLREFPNVTFFHGDAAELDLHQIGAELMVSRLGVMFFGDPVAAFANLRTGLARGGRLRFLCWRRVDENPYFEIPLNAVCGYVPPAPAPDPEAPSAFAFADKDRLTRILTAAGFTAPAFTPLEVDFDVAAGGSLDDAVSAAAQVGPTKRALAGQPDEVRAAALAALRQALEPFARPSGVKLGCAFWLVAAERAD